MTTIDPPKPWPVATFENLRRHLTTFVNSSIIPLLEDTQCRRIILRAPVKCGKREMVEYIAMRDLVGQPSRIHLFLSAWHRAADEDQRRELCTQNLHVFSITTQKNVDNCWKFIKSELDKGKKIVLHLDECDHGSGIKQMLSQVWNKIRDNINITNILYSATPQEVLFSGEIDDDDHRVMMEEMITEGHHVEYSPPAGYCGPAKFLSPGDGADSLIKEAIPFFYKENDTYSLSEQGKEIMRDLCASLATNPSRNLIVLRLSYSDLGGTRGDRKENKAIHQFLKNLSSFPELAGVSVIADKDKGITRYAGVRCQKIEWSSRGYWDDLATGKPMIFVIDQTSSRSTEWMCHNRIFATHDFRNMIQYSTISQAQERVNHYEQKYGGFQPIRIYGHIKTFLLSAGLIDYGIYLKHDWEKRKVDIRTAGNLELYKIRSTSAGHAIHPMCNKAGITEAAADKILQHLGCYADVSISARVVGKIRDVKIYSVDWREATMETFSRVMDDWQRNSGNESIVEQNRIIRNPFNIAKDHKIGDIWQGQHRGWKVLDFVDGSVYQRPMPGLEFTEPKKLDLGSTGGDRTKVCYSNGKLGVLIVRCTGIIQMDSLTAFKSMYRVQTV